MLYLQEASVAAPDGDRDHIQELDQMCPTCWFVIYQADSRCRSEQLEYLHRDAMAISLTTRPSERPASLADFVE